MAAAPGQAIGGPATEAPSPDEAEASSDDGRALFAAFGTDRLLLALLGGTEEHESSESHEGSSDAAADDDDRVLFSAFGTDRLLRVKAVQALFEEVGHGHRDDLKASVWGFLDEPVCWQFRADAGWCDCDAATQEALRVAEARHETVVELRVRSWAYGYDLDARMQTNRSTRRTRPLRRRNPWAALAVGAGAPAAAPAPGAAALPRWQFSTGFGWADCGEDVQRLLRAAQARGEVQVRQVVREWDYTFDLAAGTQTNEATGRVRNLRLFTPPGPSASAADGSE